MDERLGHVRDPLQNAGAALQEHAHHGGLGLLRGGSDARHFLHLVDGKRRVVDVAVVGSSRIGELVGSEPVGDPYFRQPHEPNQTNQLTNQPLNPPRLLRVGALPDADHHRRRARQLLGRRRLGPHHLVRSSGIGFGFGCGRRCKSNEARPRLVLFGLFSPAKLKIRIYSSRTSTPLGLSEACISSNNVVP